MSAAREIRAADDQPATVVQDILSDDSVAWNVRFVEERSAAVITFACTSRAKAIKLAQCLNETCWADVDEPS